MLAIPIVTGKSVSRKFLANRKRWLFSFQTCTTSSDENSKCQWKWWCNEIIDSGQRDLHLPPHMHPILSETTTRQHHLYVYNETIYSKTATSHLSNLCWSLCFWCGCHRCTHNHHHHFIKRKAIIVFVIKLRRVRIHHNQTVFTSTMWCARYL